MVTDIKPRLTKSAKRLPDHINKRAPMLGGLVALPLAGLNLSVSALVGFIALFGVAVQNGVLLIERIRELRRHGHPMDAAVREGEGRDDSGEDRSFEEVALAWPLWQRRAEVRRRGLALVCAALIGGLAAGGSAVAMAWGFDLPVEVVRSLASKSVTAPVAMGIAERIGGVPALAAVFAVVTGLVGALSGKYVFDGLRIGAWAVRGFALGTTAHGIGAARALQVDADAGAYAGIALGLQVLLASLLTPLLFRWFG